MDGPVADSVIGSFYFGALTESEKPDIMKFREALCIDEQPKGGIR